MFFKRAEISKANVLVAYFRKASGSTSSAAKDSSTSDAKERLERLQINSRLLVEELGSISGLSMSKTPCIMVPPFKLLVGERDKINERLHQKRQEAKEEQEKMENTAEIGPKTSDEDTKEEERKEKKRLVNHLDCLLAFIDKELKHVMDLRQKIADGKLEKISFDNLWHLFEPGDVVFSSVRPGKGNDDFSYLRSFCVHKVTGGRKSLSVRSSRASNQPHDKSAAGATDSYNRKGEYAPMSGMGITPSPFILDLNYVDFDGTYIGAQTIDKSVIKYYDGEKKITDLDFYPARFDPEKVLKFGELEKRGQKFISLVERPAHKLYDGMTVGEDAEHVHGEVHIDFRTGHMMLEDDFKSLDIGDLKWTAGEDREVCEPGEENCLLGGTCITCTNNFDDNAYDHKRYNEYHAEHLLRSTHIDDLEDQLKKPTVKQLFYRTAPREVLGYFFRAREWRKCPSFRPLKRDHSRLTRFVCQIYSTWRTFGI